MKVLAAITLLSLVQFAPLSAAQADDAALTESATRSVSTYARYSVFDHVSITARDGEVVLTGKVTQPIKKEDIGRRIAELDGVRAVHNQIDVLPVSIADDRIRRSVARAIYGSPTFWRFAAMPNPPIHILVEHGRVTLTGVVPTHVERTVAQSLATGHGEFSVHNVLRTDAEVKVMKGA